MTYWAPVFQDGPRGRRYPQYRYINYWGNSEYLNLVCEETVIVHVYFTDTAAIKRHQAVTPYKNDVCALRERERRGGQVGLEKWTDRYLMGLMKHATESTPFVVECLSVERVAPHTALLQHQASFSLKFLFKGPGTPSHSSQWGHKLWTTRNIGVAIMSAYYHDDRYVSHLTVCQKNVTHEHICLRAGNACWLPCHKTEPSPVTGEEEEECLCHRRGTDFVTGGQREFYFTEVILPRLKKLRETRLEKLRETRLSSEPLLPPSESSSRSSYSSSCPPYVAPHGSECPRCNWWACLVYGEEQKIANYVIKCLAWIYQGYPREMEREIRLQGLGRLLPCKFLEQFSVPYICQLHDCVHRTKIGIFYCHCREEKLHIKWLEKCWEDWRHDCIYPESYVIPRRSSDRYKGPGFVFKKA